MADETPLFQQYISIKEQHPGEVLFFRVGDFYEMFNEDAVEVSKLLNLTLTHRGENPMCGVPYHAAKIYIARLLRLGRKIAIAEQIGENLQGKGLAERKVVEIITPGTAVESEYLEGGVNNFLASLFISHGKCGFAFIDVTTGEFKATSFPQTPEMENFQKELGRCTPREIILPDSLKNNSTVLQIISLFENMAVSYYPDWNFNIDSGFRRLTQQFKTVNLQSFSLQSDSIEIIPAGFLLDYLSKTTNSDTSHISSISVYRDSDFMIIDDSSRRNLEITNNLRDGSSQYSLLECVNSTQTAMGCRLVREWLMFPLTNLNEINARQNHVELFVNNRSLLRKVTDSLEGILDIERLAARIAMDRAHGKDLQALKNSLSLWLKIQGTLGEEKFSKIETESASLIINLISSAIMDDPATSLTDGNIIKEGWSKELDHWRDVHDNFNQVMEAYAQEERQRTGIQNLRIKKSGNMGYFIEVTKGKLDKVPDHFIIRRALVNAERYTTEKLQELEQNLNESGSRILELERDLFIEVRNQLKKYVPYLQQTAREIAYADVTSSFAASAVRYNWVKPVLNSERIFTVENGRHPVVEKHIPAGEFVPNNLTLCDEKNETFALITGPNMAGKSTFLRQNALICLLAQTGSFVPASKAELGIVDKIFCRVGASDNLARGESTFLIEMTETAHILRSATESSLVIMDEVGRGTSTEDGLSIAWAVSEYLLNRIKCKTLFATHYHELTRMENPAAKKLCMAVEDEGSNVVFLRKVIEGESANSYGIHVARLAGVPETVIKRAQFILDKIRKDAGEQTEIDSGSVVFEEVHAEENKTSLTGALFSDEELILDEILSSDTNNLTPIQALQMIARWKQTLSGR